MRWTTELPKTEEFYWDEPLPNHKLNKDVDLGSALFPPDGMDLSNASKVAIIKSNVTGAYDQAQAEAEKFLEHAITTEARLDLYNAAVKRYKEEVDAAALEKIQDEMRDQIRKEVVAEYQGELKAQFEQQLTDDRKAAMKKEVREEYEAMLSRMRSGMI